jgi:hypothetical protein
MQRGTRAGAIPGRQPVSGFSIVQEFGDDCMSVESLVWTTTPALDLPLAMAAVLVTGCGKGTGKVLRPMPISRRGLRGDEIAAVDHQSLGITKKKPPLKKIARSDWRSRKWLKDPGSGGAEGPTASAAPWPPACRPASSKSGTDKPAADTEKRRAHPATPAGRWNGRPHQWRNAGGRDEAIKNSLADKLQNKGRYDSTYKELAWMRRPALAGRQ